MIVESAFAILPESVAGLGFQRVKREANAVGSFTFSLLNALHAKNVIDPIRRLQIEKHYATKTTPLPVGGNERHCDIYIDYGGSKIGSQGLANFGWRYHNYIEAKFFKSYKQTKSGQDTRASTNSGELIADLIRLVALVPEPDLIAGGNNPRTSSARYFLAIADKPLSSFVNQYLKDIYTTFENPPRKAAITVDLSTGKSAKALAAKVGTDFNRIKLDLTHCTCISHYPLIANQQDSCWMILVRIDAATISLTSAAQPHAFTISADRTLHEQAQGDYKIIRDFVASNIL